jgi:hypothetical protein
VQTFARTWHHKPYYDEAVEAIEEINTLLPMLEQYSSDTYAESMIKNARESIAKAQAEFGKARARFEGEPLRDKVVQAHGKLDVCHPPPIFFLFPFGGEVGEGERAADCVSVMLCVSTEFHQVVVLSRVLQRGHGSHRGAQRHAARARDLRCGGHLLC